MEHLHESCQQLLDKKGLDWSDIEVIMMCGKFCTGEGLYQLPPLTLPVALSDFAKAVRWFSIPKLAHVPVGLIPVIHLKRDFHSKNDAWIDYHTSGEATAAVAINDPRSEHNKEQIIGFCDEHCTYLSIDSEANIIDLSFSSPGELMWTITKGARSELLPDRPPSKTYNFDFLMDGFWISEQDGISSIFRVVEEMKRQGCYSIRHADDVLLGGVLRGDIQQLQRMMRGNPDATFTLTGDNTVQRAIAQILAKEMASPSYFPKEDFLTLCSQGAMIIWEDCEEFNPHCKKKK